MWSESNIYYIVTVLTGSVQGFFFFFFLGTYRLSHCWIFIMQPQTFRSLHHFFLFFFSLSPARSLYHGLRRPLFLRFPLCTFSDCSFCIFSLSLSLRFAFGFAFQSLLVYWLFSACHPLNTCRQPLSFENVFGFCSLFYLMTNYWVVKWTW